METLGFNFTQAEYINIQLLPKLSNVHDKTVAMLLEWLNFSCFFFSLFFLENFGSGVNYYYCIWCNSFETVWTVINKFPTEYVYLISQALINVDFEFLFV